MSPFALFNKMPALLAAFWLCLVMSFAWADMPLRDIREFSWLGMTDDRVGDWGNGKPNGTPDGHFRLTLDLGNGVPISSISVYSANKKGEKTGGQVWHSQSGSYWMLGVFRDGRQLNASHIGSLGNFSGMVTFDLYANSSGWFKPGQWFLVEIGYGSGQTASRTLRLGKPETGGPAQPSSGGRLVLEDDAGPYHWVDATEVQTRQVHAGRAAFLSNGNDHFTHRLGLVGNYAGQNRYLDFWLYFDKPGADIQLQVQVDGAWGKRWGFEAGPIYDGYGWAMEGTSTGLSAGQWLHQRVDLIEQLHIHAGQAITGLAFSSDGADVYYDSVYLLPSDAPLPPPLVQPAGKRVLEDDTGPYQWVDATVVQSEVVAFGQAAFRADGNDHFTSFLGIVGDYPEQFRSLSFWVLPIGPEADIQLQVQVDGAWGKRWGYEAGAKYDGFGWAMEGTSTGLRPGVWQELKIDLVRDLHINPGQKITGLAFSSDNGDVYYDSVYLHANPSPALKPSFQPTGKRVLEDDAGGYGWVDTSELQDYLVFHGSQAFKSNGNDHFQADLGVAGNDPGQFRSIGFWAFFMGPTADLQLQVQVNGSWGKRWGYETGPKYDGFGWAMEGTSTNMPNGRWTWIQADLLNQLHLKPGDRITGLAFSSDNGDVAYDSVYLLPSGTAPGIVPGDGPQEPPGGRDYTGYEVPPPPVGQATASFDNFNIGGVGNGPSQPTTFTFNEARVVTLIQNYHWNSARGASPGTISVRDAQGRIFGPWQTMGSPGQGGVPNAFWTARPQATLPAGTYTVIDSDPASWSHNAQSGYRGFTRVESYPARDDSVPGGRDYTGVPVQSEGQLIFEVSNIAGVDNGPTKATRFTLAAPHTITLIRNYHWNHGRGTVPGSIALKGKNGATWGPWQASGSPGQGGVPNAYWTANPNVSLPAGTYTVVDSDPATWSHNAESNHRGFARVEGYPSRSAAPASSTGDAQVDELIEAIKSLKGLLGN